MHECYQARHRTKGLHVAARLTCPVLWPLSLRDSRVVEQIPSPARGPTSKIKLRLPFPYTGHTLLTERRECSAS